MGCGKGAASTITGPVSYTQGTQYIYLFDFMNKNSVEGSAGYQDQLIENDKLQLASQLLALKVLRKGHN